MKLGRLTVCVCIIAFLLSACLQAQEKTTDSRKIQQKASHVIQKNAGSDEGFRQAIQILSSGLKKEPNDAALLSTRANYLVELHDYTGALKDLDHAKKLKKLSPEVGLMRCMLIERIHGMPGKAKRCYDETVSQYAAKSSSDKSPNANYVLAALMAKDYNAGILKNNFMRKKNNTGPSRQLFKQFDRERYLQTILPQK